MGLENSPDSRYNIPTISSPEPVGSNEALLIASGDLRLSAN